MSPFRHLHRVVHALEEPDEDVADLERGDNHSTTSIIIQVIIILLVIVIVLIILIIEILLVASSAERHFSSIGLTSGWRRHPNALGTKKNTSVAMPP